MGGKKKIRHNIRTKLEDKKRYDDKRNNETNPFELKRNKIKHQILGRKVAKNELGKPLLNRSRAYQKRSQTLLEEYRNTHKSGKGVRDLRTSNADERVTTKYKESQNEINFSNSEEIKLTHKGKPLEDFIDDRLSSDDEDIDLFNRENYVESTHFGGGGDGAPRSSHDVLQEIMQEKQEKRLAREEVIQLTESLDSQWNQLKSLFKQNGSDTTSADTERDEYDNLLSQLMFEGKRTPTKESPITANSIPSAPQVAEADLTTQSPDAIFKAKLKSIETSSDIDLVIRLLKDVLSLLPNVTRKSFDMLKDRLQKLTLTTLKFTPKEMAIMVIGAYYKELQIVVQLMILKTLNKLKYASYHEVAVALFLNNFLVRTVRETAFYPEFFVHVHNLIRLAKPVEQVKLTLFTRLDYEAKAILSVRNFGEDRNMTHSFRYLVTPFTLFGRVFVRESNQYDQPELVPYTLLVQAIKLAMAVFDKFAKLNIIGMMMKPICDELRALRDLSPPISIELVELIDRFEERFTTKKADSVIVNRLLPKPIILPMLEPKFHDGNGKRVKDETRKLTRKLKREMKGAKREIRKDANFLRDTYLKDVEKKDRARKQKVNAILRDISVQQGLYKKKK